MIDKTVASIRRARRHPRWRDHHDQWLRRGRNASDAGRRVDRAGRNATTIVNNAATARPGSRRCSRRSACAADLFVAPGRFVCLRRAGTPDRSSSSSFPRAISPSGFVRQAPAGITRPATGRCSPKAKHDHRRPRLCARISDPRRLRADQADRGDRWGNSSGRRRRATSARSWRAAAKCSIARCG